MIKIPGRSSSASTCSPVLSEQYDEEFFAQHRVLLPAFRALADLLWNHMKTPQHPHPSILDVGCGHGFMVESLRQCGFTAYGIDGSSSATSLWPVQYLDCYQVGDLTQTKTLKQFPKTDCICSFETAEHLPERVSQRF
ncbi:MAG: methyltransferase domain-containing protein, partial [Gammaproteobacteria bacterium]